MDGKLMKQVRDALLERRRQIGSDLERERESSIMMEDASTELVDIAQSLEQFDRDASLAEQERRELNAIEHALGKLMSGSFGICEDCEEEIPPRRLMIIPQARLCAHCQEFEERQHGRGRNLPAAAAR